MKGKRGERRPTAQGSLNDLGSRILNQSRYELSLSMRHLARALDRLPYEMDFNTQRMGTEGERIHFHPEFIFQLFMESPQKLNRLYMHSLLHCLFRHMFKNEDKKEELWNMACDIHVEYVLDSLDVDLLKRPAGEYRENTFQRLEEKIKTLSAERIYQYLEEADLDYDAWERLEREFYKDDHVFWKVIDRKDAPGQEGEGDSDGAPLPLPEDFTPNDNPSGEENEGEKKDSGDNTSAENSEDKDKSPRESKSSEDASPQSGTPSNGEGKEEKNQEAGNQEPENRGSEGERETRKKTAKGKPSKRIVNVGILPEKSRKKEKKRKTESPQDRRKEKSGKPRKRGMSSLRNGRTSVKGQSRKSNIPLKKNKKNREVWPGFCVWNRRNIRIFGIFSGGSPWIEKKWK